MPDWGTTPGLALLAAQPWDILVVGGGITGAGVMREAARIGMRVLLVEQNDFASGTSGRSAKLVHGGLHYLPRLQFGLVREAVRERERLIRAGTGLVERQGFLLLGEEDRRRNWLNLVGLGLYDLMAGQVPLSRHVHGSAVARYAPGLTTRCTDALAYGEATIDDARLVLRVIHQGCRFGGHALNYVAATDLLYGTDGQVCGVRLRDTETGEHADVHARVVVNASGPWADVLRGQLGAPPRLRLVRGSHLIFPHQKLPLARAIATRHPDSHLPICLVPWEGVTMVGTTNVDDAAALQRTPRIMPEETDYLLRAVEVLFPSLRLGRADIGATFAGVRPIVDNVTLDAATASRDYAIWDEGGLITVAGGKLTTFHPMALRTLQIAAQRWPQRWPAFRRPPVLEDLPPVPPDLPFDAATALRLSARYGPDGLVAIAAMTPNEHRPIPDLCSLWGELRWAARAECVRHLDDLLLRRVRIGLTAAEGGLPWCEEIRAVVQTELGWSDERWDREVETYRQIWHRDHGVPEVETSLTIKGAASGTDGRET